MTVVGGQLQVELTLREQILQFMTIEMKSKHLLKMFNLARHFQCTGSNAIPDRCRQTFQQVQ